MSVKQWLWGKCVVVDPSAWSTKVAISDSRYLRANFSKIVATTSSCLCRPNVLI